MLPVQYADYAAWQREWLQGRCLRTNWATGEPSSRAEHLELPTDRPRPSVASHHGANLTVDLPAPLAAALKGLGRQRRHDAVHEAARGLPGAALSLQRTRGHCGGHAHCRPRRTELEGLIGSSPTPWCCAGTSRAIRGFASCWLECAKQPWRLRPSGSAVRKARRGIGARPRHEPQSPIPGAVRPAKQPGRRARAWRV